MSNSQSRNESKSKRVFLRIPLKISVKVYHEGKFIGVFTSSDLSASGIALDIAQVCFDFESAEVHFKTGSLSRMIKAKVRIKNKIKTDKGLRLGCLFVGLSEKDENLITKYIANFCNYLAPSRSVNLVSFLCFIDLLFRVALGLLVSSYLITQLGEEVSFFLSKIPKLILLSLYSIAVFSAFVFSDRYFVQKSSKYLNYSFACLGLALAFTVFKCQQYWALGFCNSEFFIVRLFCYGYSLFVLFALTSFFKTIRLLRKVKIVMESEKIHRSHI